MEPQQPATTNREAYERFLKGVKRMVAEKKEERRTAAERYQNNSRLKKTIAELRELNGSNESPAN